jgi:hypothetical protein
VSFPFRRLSSPLRPRSCPFESGTDGVALATTFADVRNTGTEHDVVKYLAARRTGTENDGANNVAVVQVVDAHLLKATRRAEALQGDTESDHHEDLMNCSRQSQPKSALSPGR